MTHFQITVPATSANLGPGFDTLGLALEPVMTVDLEVLPSGDEVCLLSADSSPQADPHDNLLVRAYRTFGEREGKALPGARFSIRSEIPVARGLGSSAACIVAGLAAAATVTETKDARDRLLRWGTELEGHPDNIAAALMGGMTVAFREGEAVHALHVANHLALGIALFVPEGELRTDHAREMIPASVPLTDAVFDLSRLGYFITAMMWGRWDLIGPAMEDRLHQPYRAPAIPALDTVIRAAREAGAYGAALSGGGPSVIALCRRGDEARIGDAMCEAASAEGWRGNPLLTGVRERGVTVRKEKASEDEPTPSE